MKTDIPYLPSPAETGLHENELKRFLNQSKDKRFITYTGQLTSDLARYIKSTEQKVSIRSENFGLSRGVRRAALDCQSSRKDEDRLEAKIHERWKDKRRGPAFLSGLDDAVPIVKYIPSSQIPLFNKGGRGGKGNWGYIDLLGCDYEHRPVVIELKIMRFGKGARPETPLRAVVEALAYSISITTAWKSFEPEWSGVVKPQEPLAKPIGLSLVVLGTSQYWEAVRESTWISQAKEAMPSLLTAMGKAGFPCHFASIDAECMQSGRRDWTIGGPAKEIHPFER